MGPCHHRLEHYSGNTPRRKTVIVLTSPAKQHTGWSWIYLEYPSLQPGLHLWPKCSDCNDVGVVGEVESHPRIGVLLVTLGSWPHAVVATVPPIGQFAV